MNQGLNRFSSPVSWPDLCLFSRTPVPRELENAPWNPRLVYMANHGNGGREHDAVPFLDNGGFIPDPEATAVPGVSPRGWDGYQEHGAKLFAWSSSSSDARIVACRQPGAEVWLLHFYGCTAQGRMMESSYLLHFLSAAKGEILVTERANPGLLTALFRDRIAREPTRAEEYRAMARRIHAEI